jgi:hypothetical protein
MNKFSIINLDVFYKSFTVSVLMITSLTPTWFFQTSIHTLRCHTTPSTLSTSGIGRRLATVASWLLIATLSKLASSWSTSHDCTTIYALATWTSLPWVRALAIISTSWLYWVISLACVLVITNEWSFKAWSIKIVNNWWVFASLALSWEIDSGAICSNSTI